ncbi:hypothetical protein BU15DRAFT_63167 [Melanogaster broomeanus]|nr:hypothetical protein BU15DRAFT_63167 [Melanogaster broomeanus]
MEPMPQKLTRCLKHEPLPQNEPMIRIEKDPAAHLKTGRLPLGFPITSNMTRDASPRAWTRPLKHGSGCRLKHGSVAPKNDPAVSKRDTGVHRVHAMPQKPETMRQAANDAAADATNPDVTSAGLPEPAGTSHELHGPTRRWHKPRTSSEQPTRHDHERNSNAPEHATRGGVRCSEAHERRMH